MCAPTIMVAPVCTNMLAAFFISQVGQSSPVTPQCMKTITTSALAAVSPTAS